MAMRQDYRENLRLAMDTLRAHKLRSFLAILGVMIGVALIILVVGLIQGFRNTVQQMIEAEGVETAWIDRFSQGPHIGRRPAEERQRPPLTLEEGQAIQEQCPDIKQTAISVFEWQQQHDLRYGKNFVLGGEFRGTFPPYLQVYSNATLKAGRFFTEGENDHRSNVVVLGEDAAKALFPTVNDAIGRDVLVDGSTFKVIGIFERPVEGFETNNDDRRVVIPYYTFLKLYSGQHEIAFRILAFPGRLDKAVDEARGILRRMRRVPYDKPDNFSIQTQVEAAQNFNEIIGGVVLVIIVLSSIGLLIGGMGVMNIMLVSVTERTREIGVRKAIGARRSDITWQFLFEAMTLTGSGGIIGILLGSSIVLLIPLVTSMKAVIPLWAVIVGFTVSVSIGLIFGVWPATKAAKLDPVEALRYE
ncbi:MAG TPA: ABC transporter permease [Candidatus Acidoferrales bacterium]|nr:ABC transporter permease [Candidatus Acidoferrales bacterium]